MRKWFVTLMVIGMALSLVACGGDEPDSESQTEQGDQAEETASWADRHAALVKAGDGAENEDFEALRTVLNDLREESGAQYEYALTPAVEAAPSLDGDPNGDYLITVDGHPEGDDYGTSYGWEVQFTEAWEGAAASARSGWDEDETTHCWSVFAPVYDSEDNLSCILGIDYPCSELLEQYPEWNRDTEVWNGFTDEMTEDMPADLQAEVDELLELVASHAEQLAAAE